MAEKLETQDFNMKPMEGEKKIHKANREDSEEEYFSFDEDELEKLDLDNKTEYFGKKDFKASKCTDTADHCHETDKSECENTEKDVISSEDSENLCKNKCDKSEYNENVDKIFEDNEDVEKLLEDNEEDDIEDKEEEIDEEEYRRSIEETLSDDEKLERKEKGQVLKDEGNKLFRLGNYSEALVQYSEALNICPYSFPKERSIMFANRGACQLKLDNSKEGIKDCSSAIELHPHYVKAILRRAELYEKTEKLDEALADYQKAVELDPSQTKARITAIKLSEEIKDRNEKMKTEMLGKLKDLGNLVLKPFGLSTENFQLAQNPDTGSYSVNFKQN